ncbi:MAG: hypothetical protein JEY97_15000 [Bacteroidales bacterium]|nr:hypothetical protein [Bacteroidales bacterium]
MVFVIFPCFISCQNQSDKEHKSIKIIKYDITSLMGDGVTNSSGIQVGIELELKDNFSFEQDLMYIFGLDKNDIGYFEIDVENVYGLKSVSELRYYLKHGIEPKLTGVYLAPNLILQYTNALRKQLDENHISNSYHVNRFVFALHGKLGIQFVLYKNLFLDISAGFGIRYISSNSFGEKNDYISEYEYPYNKTYNTGSNWFPSITGGFRLGYKL